MRGESSGTRSAARSGLAGFGVAVFAIICCGAAPVLVAAAGGIALGAALGMLGGAIALVAIGTLLVLRTRRRRACTPQIELLYFDGCPNHEAFLPRLRRLLAEAGVDEEVHLVRIDSAEDAEHRRFLGSPTLRVDGRDVEPGAAGRSDYGLKCRLYSTEAGVMGLPPDDWVLRALGAAPGRVASGSAAVAEPPALGLPGTRSWASRRLAGLSPAQRRLHRRILAAFDDGIAPRQARLAEWAAAEDLDLDEAAGALESQDLVHRDRRSGDVTVAYPFSVAPTVHRVRLGNGSEVFAMCALDALGIAFMLDTPTRIVSADPGTREPVEVSVDPDRGSEWVPRDAVVVVGRVGSGSSADCMCPHTNFAASRAHAQAQLDDFEAGSGEVLSMPEALAVGRELFGAMLV